jgi:hypothetical protein
VDVVVPAGDPLHSDDIRLAAHWMGDAWSAALGSHTRTWRSGVTNPSASAIACFAGVGPGEVTLHGRKLVGISQRRTRDWSRFQCVTYYRWVPEELLRLGVPWLSLVTSEYRRFWEIAAGSGPMPCWIALLRNWMWFPPPEVLRRIAQGLRRTVTLSVCGCHSATLGGCVCSLSTNFLGEILP